MAKEESETLDLEDRDPQHLNQHIEVAWEEIFGEPNTIRSPECAWSVSQNCFKFSRTGVYICLSVICAPIAACCLGVSFAILSFEHIWCTVPCLRMWKISCLATRSFVKGFTHGMIIPFMDAFGQCLSHIRVRTGILQETEEKKDDVLII